MSSFSFSSYVFPFLSRFLSVSLFCLSCFCLLPSSVLSPTSIHSPLFPPPALLQACRPVAGAGRADNWSRAGQAGGSLGFSPKAQECVESGGTVGACSRKDGASIWAGEAFHILGSAEWEYRGPGAGGGPHGCRHGGPAGLPGAASVCWRFRESSDLRGDCVFPWSGLSWGAGPRRPAACAVASVYLSLGCLGPTQSSPPTELQRQPQRRLE